MEAYLAEGNLNKKTGTQETNGTINITNISPYFIENTKQFAARFNREAKQYDRICEYGPSTVTKFSCQVLGPIYASNMRQWIFR